jgi:hypothetical protein
MKLPACTPVHPGKLLVFPKLANACEHGEGGPSGPVQAARGGERTRVTSRPECSLRSADGCLDEMDPMDPMDLMDPNREALQAWQRGGGRLGFEHRARATSHRDCSLRPADGCLDEMDPMDGMDDPPFRIARSPPLDQR